MSDPVFLRRGAAFFGGRLWFFLTVGSGKRQSGSTTLVFPSQNIELAKNRAAIRSNPVFSVSDPVRVF